MSKPIPIARTLAFASLVLSAACTDRSPTGAAGTPPAGREVRTQLSCDVSVADRAVRCGDPASAGGGAQDVILGGQDTYLRLESANAAYDSTSAVFSMDVTVQNLMSLQMGTPDGSTATGVRIFFEQMPTAVEGAGEIEVANPDGKGSFTRIDQPYFAYPGILEPRGTSLPRTWRFNVPTSVDRFRFTVYVHTKLPAEQGVLRWEHEWGYGTRFGTPFDAVWGASREHVFAVGGRWILGRDSTGWVPMAQAPGYLYDLWGTSRYEVYAAGDSGAVMRYDGNRWTLRRGPVAPEQLSGLWSDGADLWAVGRHRETPAGDVDGLILRSDDDGETWTETRSPGAGKRYLRDVFRVDSSVYVVGFEDPVEAGAGFRNGVLLRSRDGGATWSDSLFSAPRGMTFNSVWADGPDDVTIGGEMLDSAGARHTLLMRSTDGGETWTTAPGFTGNIQNLWRVPGGRLYAVGSSAILVNDGGTWTEFYGGPCVGMAAGWTGVWGSAEDDLYVVANTDYAWHYDGTCWRYAPARRGGWVERLNAVSAAENFAVAVGYTPVYSSEGELLYNQGVLLGSYWGSDWALEYEPEFSSSLEDVWTGGLDLIVAVGWREHSPGVRGGLLVRNAAQNGWVDVTPAAAADVPLSAVWEAGNEVHAFGVRAGSIVAYRTINGGSTWSETSIPYTGAGTPRVTDAWGSAGLLHVSGYAEVVSGADTTHESFTLRHDGAAWALSVGAGDGAQLTGTWSTGASVFVSGHRPAGASRWNGFVRRSDDGGQSWVETALQPHGGNGRVDGIWGASTSAVYAVGGGGVVHLWDGVDWTSVLGVDRAALFGVAGTTARDVYVVGETGAIYHGTR